MKQHRYFFLTAGLLMALSELWKQYTLTFPLGGGAYNWWYLPFQLCSIPMYICLILPWIKQDFLSHTLAAFLVNYGLLGGIFAFFDTSGMHYDYFPLTVHSYLWHIGLLILGLSTAVLIPSASTLRCYISSSILYLICCGIAVFLDIFLDRYGTINMFYINPHYPMSQKVFSTIAGYIGNIPGIFFYIGCCVLGAACIHMLWKYITLSKNQK